MICTIGALNVGLDETINMSVMHGIYYIKKKTLDMLKGQIVTLDWLCEVETVCLQHEAVKKSLLPVQLNVHV